MFAAFPYAVSLRIRRAILSAAVSLAVWLKCAVTRKVVEPTRFVK